MKPNVFALTLAVSLLLGGCLQLWDPEDAIRQATPVPISVQADDRCWDPGPCLCMRCTSATSSIWPWAETSLAGGKCEFLQCHNIPPEQHDLTAAPDRYYQKILEDPNSYIKTFFIGQGGTYAEFDESLKYSKSSQTLLVKWLVGGWNAPYLPSPEITECYLSANVIPAYLIYTGGRNFDQTFASNLAAQFKDKGPVILAPEVRFDANDQNQVNGVTAQVINMKMQCPNCLIAVVPKEEQAELAMGKLAPVMSSIDIVGRGMLLNERAGCDAEEAMNLDLIPFARKMLETYHKPTMVFYYGASDGGGNCALTPAKEADYTDYLMKNIPTMTSAGVIGISQMQLQDRKPVIATSVPTDVNWGLVKRDVLESQKNPAFFAWFDRTQAYYSTSPGAVGNQNPLVFSFNGREGDTCKFMENMDMSTLGARDYTQASYQVLVSPGTQDFNCSALNPNVIGSFAAPEYTDQFYPAGADCASYKLAVKVESEVCDLDPNYLRAVLAVDGVLSSPNDYADKAGKLCDAWSQLKDYAIVMNINSTNFAQDSVAKQKVGFFAAYAYKQPDKMALAKSALSGWNAIKAGSPPDVPGDALYAAWIYACSQENVCVAKHWDDAQQKYVCNDDGWRAAVLKEPFMCQVAATYNAMSCPA